MLQVPFIMRVLTDNLDAPMSARVEPFAAKALYPTSQALSFLHPCA
jgi:hypothetical protein